MAELLGSQFPSLDCITCLDSLSPRSQQRVESVCDFKFACSPLFDHNRITIARWLFHFSSYPGHIWLRRGPVRRATNSLPACSKHIPFYFPAQSGSPRQTQTLCQSGMHTAPTLPLPTCVKHPTSTFFLPRYPR
jgi:hypothetical protein